MKNKPFHFRYVNEIVGGFVLLVLILLIVAVVVAGRAQGWFEPVYRIPIDFPPQGSLDLQVGSPVQILGATVGKVEKINVDEDGFMTGLITVKGDFYQFVRTDSRVIVKKKFGVAGDAYIDITKGSGPDLPEGGGLVASKDTDLNELMQELLNQVQSATVPLLDSIKRTADEYAGLAADMRSAEGPLQKMLLNLESITRKIDSGDGPAGKLVSDPEMAKTIDAVVAQVQDAISQLQAIMADVKKATANLPSMATAVNGEVQDIPGTVALTKETIRETERLIEGIQRHWLLRKYIPQDASPPLIPAYDVHVTPGSAQPSGEETTP